MLSKLKQLSSKLVGALEPQKINSPATLVQEDVDPRICGLTDAVKRGWYKSETGELFTGFKITADDVVLDVGCGDGGATLFCARQGAHVIFSDVDAAKIRNLMERAKETEARKVEGFVSDSMPLPSSMRQKFCPWKCWSTL